MLSQPFCKVSYSANISNKVIVDEACSENIVILRGFKIVSFILIQWISKCFAIGSLRLPSQFIIIRKWRPIHPVIQLMPTNVE